MRLIKKDNKTVIVEFDRLEFSDIDDLFIYAANQYNRIDNALIRMNKEELLDLHKKIHDIVKALPS